ncbi:MAG: hypothetical protein V3T05_08540 [Myxococcota bacterium]
MSDRLADLKRAVERGELESWIAALAVAWIRTERGAAGERPTPNDLADLLADVGILAKLKREEPDGPWDVLAAQACSLHSHGHLGEALRDLSEAL